MSILLIIISVIAGIVLLVLLIAAFLPKDYFISSEILIDAPKQQVFDYIKMLKNQDHYSKWNMTDPGMKRAFSGSDGTVGFIYAWDGNKKAGEGAQEIMTINDGKNIVSEVRFIRPFAGKSELEFQTDTASENQTKVTWTTKSSMKFPMNAMVPMVKGMLKKDMDVSLQNLKNILQKRTS